MPKGVYDRQNSKRVPAPLRDRFFAKVDRPDDTECWFWRGARQASGHGHFYWGGPASGGRRTIQAHRASWQLHRGSIPDGLCVLHKCDVPWCVNPDHLFLGTKADNTHDMLAKGREARGDRLPHTKLTPTQVRAIRECQLPTRQIAMLCGVSQASISLIKNGRQQGKV